MIDYTGTLAGLIEKNADDEYYIENNELVMSLGGNRDDGYNELLLRFDGKSTDIPDEFIKEYLNEIDTDEEGIDGEFVDEMVYDYVNGDGDNGVLGSDVGYTNIGVYIDGNIDEDAVRWKVDENGDDAITFWECQWERSVEYRVAITLPEDYKPDTEKVYDWRSSDVDVLEASEGYPAGMGLEKYISTSNQSKLILIERCKEMLKNG